MTDSENDSETDGDGDGPSTAEKVRIAVSVAFTASLFAFAAWRMVTVESRCTSPPTALEFTNVPSDGTRYGRIVCLPGTENPDVSITAWREQ